MRKSLHQSDRGRSPAETRDGRGGASIPFNVFRRDVNIFILHAHHFLLDAHHLLHTIKDSVMQSDIAALGTS